MLLEPKGSIENPCVTTVSKISITTFPKSVLIVMPESYGDIYMLTGIAKAWKKRGYSVFLMAKQQYLHYYSGRTFSAGLLFEGDSTPESIVMAYKHRFHRIFFPYAETQLTKHYWEENKHAIELYAAACEITKEEIESPHVSPRKSKLISLPTRFVVIQGESTFPCKSYSKIIEVVQALHAKDVSVIQVGGNQDIVVRGVDKFFPSLQLETLQWVLSKSLGFIGPDSFVGHVSSSMDTPSVITFGSTSSNFWHPYWGKNFKILKPTPRICGNEDGCFATRCFLGKDKECQERIPVEEVLTTFWGLIDAKI